MKYVKLINIENHYYLRKKDIGKIFKVLEETSSTYLINGDEFYKYRFKDVTRELKIKQLL